MRAVLGGEIVTRGVQQVAMKEHRSAAGPMTGTGVCDFLKTEIICSFGIAQNL